MNNQPAPMANAHAMLLEKLSEILPEGWNVCDPSSHSDGGTGFTVEAGDFTRFRHRLTGKPKRYSYEDAAMDSVALLDRMKAFLAGVDSSQQKP